MLKNEQHSTASLNQHGMAYNVHNQNFLRNLGSCVILVFFHIMATCRDGDEFSSALVLLTIYTSEGYSDWKPWRNDCVVIVLLFTPQCCAMMY